MGMDSLMLSLSTEFAIREAIKLLVASRRHFHSSQVEQARKLLELELAHNGRRQPSTVRNCGPFRMRA